ncbi:MAG: DUF2975 domain-containing protein [Gemmatimonadota bacterium]
MVSELKTLGRRGLARGLRIWLDVLLGILLLAAVTIIVVWPLLSWAGHETYHITVPVTVDQTALIPPGEYEGLSLAETMGELEYVPETLPPKLAFWAFSVVVFVVILYGLLLLRRILATTAQGFPFHPENPKRLNHLGWLILVSTVLAAAAEFWGGVWALSNPKLAELPLSPSIQLDQAWLFFGLLVLVLAAIWKEAVRMAEDQSLTV